jgi:hypothetical protein
VEPTYDATTNTLRGAVEFRGYGRVFFNCPGGGHARIRVVTDVATTG